MLQSILIFMVFLGPLIFFHELGHFIMARLAGVKVEVFSIGFGPKLFKFKMGDTEYAFSLIPLGGYVKMFGDDPLSDKILTQDEQDVAFTYKSKFARFWIVFGGPLANFILAFVLYFGLLLFGETVPQPRFGHIPVSGEYYQVGVRSGDALLGVNDDQIMSFDDLNLIDSKVHSITVERDERELTFDLKKTNIQFLQDFQKFQTSLRSPIVTGVKGQQWVVSLDPNTFDLNQSLESISQSGSESIYLYETKTDLSNQQVKPEDIIKGNIREIKINGDFYEALAAHKLFPVDLVVESIVMKSPADKANLKKGDIITHINGASLTSFEDIRNQVQKFDGNKPLSIKVIRDSQLMNFNLEPVKSKVGDQEVYTVGVYSGAKVLPIKMIETGSRGLIGSFVTGLERTKEGFVKTLAGFKNLIVGDVSISNLGGPIAIGKVASDSFYISFSMFLRLMAIISINLGIINLFPIPVLDGGHIVFIILEAINKGPLSRKKMEVAQQFGLSLLFILIFIALFNDFYRIFS